VDGGETWIAGERLAPPNCPFTALIADANTLFTANSCGGVFQSLDGGQNWVHADNGITATVTLLAASPHAPGLYLAATESGQIYRSVDGATGWELINAGLPDAPINGLNISGPDTYWATTDTLYRYTNGQWSPVAFGQPEGTATTGLLVAPGEPSLIFVTLTRITAPPDVATLYRSSDAGATWAALPVTDTPHLLGIHPATGALYAADGRTLLTSPDAGETWSHSELPFALNEQSAIAVHPTDAQVLYLPLADGVAKSEDGGQSWRTLTTGLGNTAVAHIVPHPDDPAALYAASQTGVFRSADHGDTWSRLDGPTAGTADLIIVPSQPNTLYRVTDDVQILRSDDSGATWTAPWPTLRFSTVDLLAAAPSVSQTLYAHRSAAGLFRSADGGDAWRFLGVPGTEYIGALAVRPDNPDFILMGDAAGRILRSPDGGITWDAVLETPAAVTSIVFDSRVQPYFAPGKQPADPTRLYAASVGPKGALWYSNDAGDTWKTWNDALNFSNVRALAVAPHRPGVVYAAVWGGGTWRSDDGGASWQRVPGDPAFSAAAIAIDPTNTNVVYLADETTPHLYRSTDDGNTWELLFGAGADYERLVALALAPSDPSVLYVSALRADGSGALYRIDADATSGENAADVTGNLPSPPSSLAVDRYDPGRLFAVVPGAGVWKTTDEGASWRRTQSSLPDADFVHIVIDPVHANTLFLTGSHSVGDNANEVHGIWKSTDDGNTWTKVGGEVLGRASGPIRAIAFDPDNDRVMYAAGDGGIYFSFDRGETWANINGRLPLAQMNAVVTDGQTLYAGSAGGGVFTGAIHPLIGTADWSPASNLAAPIHHIQLALHPTDPQALFVSAYPGGVYQTTDGGQSWQARNLGLPAFPVDDPARQGYYALAVAPANPDMLYAGLYGQGVYRSDDGGASWRPIFGAASELRGASVRALLIHPTDPDLAYAATESGVWQTGDGGQNWSAVNEGLPTAVAVRSLALTAADQLYIGVEGYGVYTLQPENNTWRSLAPLDSGVNPTVALFPSPDNPATLFAVANPGGIFATHDGLVWREQNVGFTEAGALTLAYHPEKPGVIYAGTTDGLARSTDGGATWQPWDVGWSPVQRVHSIVLDPTHPDILYACSPHTVMKSTDGGATWSEITAGLTGQTCLNLLVDRFDPHILYLATARDGIYISRDGGETWASWNEGLRNQAAGSSDRAGQALQLSADGRLLYWGSAGSGVWRRPAAGAP
jgi:photosystem II stability/assembly factor-like uncharacterized protein